MLSITDDMRARRIERESRSRHVLDGAALSAVADLLGKADQPERLARIEEEQEALIRATMARNGRPTSAAIEWMRARDPGFVAIWERERATRSRAKSTAERVAEHVAKRSDMGEIPETDQEAIVRRIIEDPVWACWHYFPEWFTRPPSTLTRAVIKALWTVMLHGGNQSIGVPRGAGKSTITKALLTLAGLCGIIRYAVVFGSNGTKAKQLKRDIVLQLETNPRLLEDFPAACIPVRALGGRSQRCASQTFRGERTYIRYETNVIQLARIDGARCSGFILSCVGVEAGFLGLVENGVRPDFVLGDDIQSLETAASDDSIANLENAVRQGFEGLGGKDSPLRIVLLVTCTRENDFSDRTLNLELYPEYSGLRLGLVKSWGSGLDLWAKYGDLWRQDQRDGDKQFCTATAFYSENRAAMDDGAEVTDPEFYLHGLELSALQSAWNQRLRMGDEGYFAQIENRPLSPRVTLYDLNPKIVAAALNHHRRRQAPAWASSVFLCADVMGDKLRWSAVAAGTRMRSAVIDYGIWPQTGIIVPKNTNPQAAMDLLWRAMDGLCQHWAQCSYVRGEEPLRVQAAGFDRGWQPEAVQMFCRSKSVSYPFPLIPLRGQGFVQWRPSNRNTIRGGWHTQMVSLSDGAAPGEFINVHTDFWKETLQRAFLSDSPDKPGACSLWGTDARSHAEFADHICAEILSDKGVGAAGTEFWKWSLRPGSKNHWFDATVGCLALAGFFGVLRADDRADEQPKSSHQAAPSNLTGARVRPLRQPTVPIEE